MNTAMSWGRLRIWQPADNELHMTELGAPLPVPGRLGMIAHGLGRSYGDVALNPGGILIHTRRLNRCIDFDHTSGLLRAESGVSVAEVLALTMPLGWVLPVMPGTSRVTLGGAVANDVHGKNHRGSGTFGHHVKRLTLQRSTGESLECSAEHHPDLLRATVGGLGLTGLITVVVVQLVKLDSDVMRVQNHRFKSLDEFWDMDRRLCSTHAYTVAWLDVKNERGIYSAADTEPSSASCGTPINTVAARVRIPLTPPFSLTGAAACRLFNAGYYHRPLRAEQRVPLVKHLFPLDGLEGWNRLHGPAGFVQYQCVLPERGKREALASLTRLVRQSGLRSALTVLKTFGDRPSAGLLSFPIAGVTLAMDFPYRGPETFQHLQRFDALVAEAGGRLYPAKDSRMSPGLFNRSFEHLNEFARWLDPGFSSGFWRRVRP